MILTGITNTRPRISGRSASAGSARVCFSGAIIYYCVKDGESFLELYISCLFFCAFYIITCTCIFTRKYSIASMQCLGASGACHMGAVFINLHYAPFQNGGIGKIYIPEQTWGEASLSTTFFFFIPFSFVSI